MIIYRIFVYISFLSYLLIVFLGYCIFKLIKDTIKEKHISIKKWINEIGKELHGLGGKYSIILILVLFASFVIASPAIHQIIGVENLEIKPEGTYCYYVEASTLDSKTYTLPAQVRVEEEREDVDENKRKTVSYYYIEKIVFTNGGYVSFSDSDSVEINESAFITDDNGTEWELTLLNKHAYSPIINETNNVNAFNVITLIIEAISVGIFVYAVAVFEKNEIAKENT